MRTNQLCPSEAASTTPGTSLLMAVLVLGILAFTCPFTQASPGGTVYFVHSDHLGTPQQMTDESGGVVWSAYYDPFGHVSLPVATVSNDLRFPGQYFDAETGLHYNYFRDYDPSTGRYVQSDPIGMGGGVNTYAYVGNNPLNGRDPFGLVTWRGNIVGGSFVTAGLFIFDLKSDCVDGKQGSATVVLAGPGLGFGAKFSASGGDVELNDSLSFVAPYVFDDTSLDGGFIATVGLAIPGDLGTNLGRQIIKPEIAPSTGGSCLSVRLGAAGGLGCGPVFGFEFGGGVFFGSSTVLSGTVEPCDECK